MSDYLNVVYNKNNKPETSYPKQLVSHLFKISKMKAGMSLLEAGVGRGEHLRAFKDLGLITTGLDISPVAKEISPDLDINISDIGNKTLPYPDNYFDVVYSKSFIEHINEVELYFQEVFRILKPGGIVLNLTPDWEANYKIFYDDYTHIRPFTIISLLNIHKVSGFNNANVFKLRQLPVVWKYPILNLLCAIVSPFVPVRSKNKFLRWSRELMLVAIASKPDN